jgi:hypothetical protein
MRWHFAFYLTQHLFCVLLNACVPDCSAGYRPSNTVILSANCGKGVGELVVDTEGALRIEARPKLEQWISLDGCSFSTT